MPTCEKCNSPVIHANKHRINRETWELDEPNQVFELDPEPHALGRFYILDRETDPMEVVYVPLNEEENLENPEMRYVPHVSVCSAVTRTKELPNG